MNNCWYVVRPEILDNEGNQSVLYFRPPCEPGTGAGGWMQPSTENRIENIKHEAASPQKQFTREEIEKHNKENDCWIVINGKVYDATSVLDWHPGGKAPIMAHAGRAHPDTTDDFESIHDDYAEQKLSGTIYPFPRLLKYQLTGHRMRPRCCYRKDNCVHQEAGRRRSQREIQLLR